MHLRSRTPCGILQEMYDILLLPYNAVRFLVHEAAMTVDIAPRRLSLAVGKRWRCSRTIP